MYKDNIKSTAITYKGYDYQTLFGISILADWLNFPDKYQKVLFEATDDTDYTPQALDDVICVRKDNKYDYYQVKYSPSPEKEENEFSWDWILKKSGKTERSKSILRKIYDAYKRIPLDQINSINLVTNKRLARDVEPCFRETPYLQFELIPKNIQDEIIKQLGSKSEAKTFIENLKVAYDDPIYLVLENQVQDSLMKVSDEIGCLRLLYEAKKWATIQHYPAPQGWITLDILRSVIHTKRPEPIPQSFYISDDYVLPDESFHENFVSEIIDEAKTNIHVLTGSPGLGKSTYLSYLCNELEDKKIPYIRHHYFISTSDRTQDRLSLRIIAESLYSQIRRFHHKINISSHEQPENLTNILENCGRYYKKSGKPFILIIDGLDHVWRDNNRNINPLKEIFKTLLPLPDNLKIIVGTQPVDDEYLPKNLLILCPKKNWTYLPPMSGNAISAYINKRIKDGALITNDYGNKDEIIAKAASALLNSTHGYPLQLIYTCEYLRTNLLPINEWQINKLPMHSGEDIQKYYLLIWQTLNHKQKEILHLIVNFNFFWPKTSFNKIFSDSLLDINSVIFLLHESLSGLRPFHESLSVFVKSRDNHDEIIELLLLPLCTWLEHDAPESLKQRWLWHCHALLGNTSPLRSGLTRDWIIDRLVESYDPQIFIDLLTQAETVAFKERQYAEAYKHRSIKTRLLNGPQYQLTDFNQLKIIFLTTAPQSAINELVSLHHQLSVADLAILSIALWYRNQKPQALSTANLCFKRFVSEERLYNGHEHNELYNKNLRLTLAAKILCDENYINSLIHNGKIKNWNEEWIPLLCQTNCLSNNFEQLLDVFNVIENENIQKMIAEKIIILGSIEEIEFESLENERLFNICSLGKVVQILENNLFKKSYLISEDKNEAHYLVYKSDQLTFNYKDYFFDNFFQHLASQGGFNHLPILGDSVKASLYNLLVKLCDHIVKLIEYNQEIKFIEIYSLLNSSDLPIDENYKDKGELIRFKNNWFEICIIVNLIVNRKSINLSDFKGSEEKEFFNIDWFIDWYAEQNIKYFNNETIEHLFETINKRFSQEIQETNERCDYFSNLAKIALLHHKLEYIKRYCYQCWDLILGYGWHKDVGIFEVLDSIEYLSRKNPTDALFYLEQISSEVAQISEYTDGDETRHALPQYTKLLSNLNLSCLISKFEWEVENGSWYKAENSFHQILSKLPKLSSHIWESICRTGLSQGDLYALQNNLDIERAKELINITLDHNGMVDLPNDIKETKNSSENETPSLINYEAYPLEKFPDFLKFIKSDYKNREYLLPWMEYWKPKAKKTDFIKYIWNDLKDKELLYEVENILLDPLYEIAKSVRGKKFAFDVLIKAHSNKGGWFNYHESSEQSFKRLDIVAKEYEDRADEFIQKSTQSNDTLNKQLVIPSCRLVYLLVKLNRIEEAKSFIEVMIDVLKEETLNLTLQAPNWDWEQDLDENDIAITLLVTRLHWPFTSIKQWTANELSSLLATIDYSKAVEVKLLKNLESKKLESEVVEILCVFWMACQKGYHPTIVLGEYVFARSSLSDQLLNAIESKTCNYGYYQGNFDIDSDLIERESNFRKNLGYEFPLVYLSTCEYLEEKFFIPLIEDFQHEWNKTFINEPRFHDTYQYFLERNNTGQFYTLNSHRARSAYLRVFEVAKRRYGMPNDYANFYSIKALPLETPYLSFLPFRVPWFTKWNSQEEYSIESLKDYLRNLIQVCNTSNKGQVLGALSFPIKISPNLHLDITCTIMNDKNEATERSQIVSIGLGLERNLEFRYLKSKTTTSDNFSFVGTAFPHHRYGHWFVEQDSRGIYIPIMPDTEMKIIGQSDGNLIKYLLNDMEFGVSGYWNDEWKRSYPSKMKPKCATYTLLSPQYFQYIGNTETEFKYVCKVNIASKERDYSDFQFEELTIEI
ncbi:dsDNA nuclease domain-containing protein [Acinetobacter pollinis]|uniref:dsDNA nuclease domain-containing protein n=1 Tax=Acinetobacter pollinis TaxID=2605270 RepID=UPI0018A31214|nr:dsDNA nuclease domain-containing protein [Acinetobacter pollinis]MBF7691502.1 NACHT domain-containing protein [Acinetobacter pollinis]MBF7693706.1 NACHT domain-containing protein [Acinetobacter pollinis]MBF7699221.1 NACHT domain-containing protein [Acinetobacter pollinis]MBF7701225.1 NACHT domain-containing protein [Acinetobacter pollinis]